MAEVGASATTIAQERIALESTEVTSDIDEKKGGVGKILVTCVILGAICGGVYYYMGTI